MISESVSVPVTMDGTALTGDLVVPDSPRTVVLFAHGSGSSRLSPRNRAVARTLQEAGLATLLLDLLTEPEEQEDSMTAQHRFDIALLGRRLTAAIEWLGEQPATASLPVGLFGASTGAAAALVAAAERADRTASVVSRGGRPDLAGEALRRVRAPVLLIVGGRDTEVIRLNRIAAGELNCPYDISIVPGATHLFSEPGALEQVAITARDWFLRMEPQGA